MTTLQENINDKNLIEEIREMINNSGINENEFYKTFQKEVLPLDTVKTIFQQYYYYIRTFPQILSGLSLSVIAKRNELNKVSLP